jgi:DNA-binding HxlR family transcriptional regulator
VVGKRKYDDGCAVAQALDMIGERWALLVVRDLLLGPKRFTDLLKGLPGASPDVLTQRLRDLGDAGVVQRRRLGPPVGTWVYELTPWGAELEEIVIGLARWAHESSQMRYDLALGTDSMMLSVKTLFDGSAAGGLDAKIALTLNDEPFWIQVSDGNLSMARGDIATPDVMVETDTATMTSLLQTDRTIDDALAANQIRLTGDRGVLDRFFESFAG